MERASVFYFNMTRLRYLGLDLVLRCYMQRAIFSSKARKKREVVLHGVMLDQVLESTNDFCIKNELAILDLPEDWPFGLLFCTTTHRNVLTKVFETSSPALFGLLQACK